MHKIELRCDLPARERMARVGDKNPKRPPKKRKEQPKPPVGAPMKDNPKKK